ncbi:MAG: aspartate kinase [Deltaproteobacteria bacterium]|nr:aspartate kinase [Deltaproteobacteria bacterium]MCL5792341.1 aspartate kinase [Deltaproteobacteria bacterium]
MALVVKKFGGTSVGDIEKIKNVARKVAKAKDRGDDLIVVVSAMSGETNKLVDFTNKTAEIPDLREYDVVVSTGEQVTIGLLSIAFNAMGYRAKSFLGFQVPIITDSAFSKARILRIEHDLIKKALKEGNIVVVAGFQGIDEKGNITTLGRGGSDTTAVALAAALKADLCEIYTDVDGVYTTDPNIVPEARRLDKISYEEMLEMASLGAKVLQTRSVEFAMKYKVPVMVKSTFTDSGGTLVTEEKDMEEAIVSGIAYDKNEAKITLTKIPDKPGIASRLFKPLTDANINVDMIVQNVSTEGYTDLTFTVGKADFKRAVELIKDVAKQIEAKDVLTDQSVAKISIIGAGMRSHAGIAQKMFSSLAKENINIQMISTSEIKISCVVETKYAELAVRVLHEAFNLEKAG